MEKLAGDLKQVLTEELKIHGELVQAANNLNNAIKTRSLEHIKTFSTRYDSLVAQIETMEIKRLEICDAIIARKVPAQKHLNLENVIILLPEEHRQSFIEIRTRFKATLMELSGITISNQILLSNSLMVIAKNVELISNTHNRLNGYTKAGNVDKKARIFRNMVNQVA